MTPDLQVMEVWLSMERWWDDDGELEEMTQMQKMCEEAQEFGLSFIVHHREEREGTRSPYTFPWAREMFF